MPAPPRDTITASLDTQQFCRHLLMAFLTLSCLSLLWQEKKRQRSSLAKRRLFWLTNSVTKSQKKFYFGSQVIITAHFKWTMHEEDLHSVCSVSHTKLSSALMCWTCQSIYYTERCDTECSLLCHACEPGY